MRNPAQLTLFICLGMTFYCCQSGSSSPEIKSGKVTVSGSGKDTYLEMTSNTQSDKMSMQMLIKYYISSTNKARSEMYRVVNGKTSLVMIGLMDANNPTQSVLLDDSDKTYSINKIDTSAASNDILRNHTKYSVSKIGDDNIQGLNCVHVQIIKTMNFSGVQSFMNSNDTIDLWATGDLPVPKTFNKATIKGLGLAFNGDVANQLLQMGCTGFPVKFQMHSRKISSLSQLTKVAHDAFPESMFEIPKDYKQTEGF